MPVEEPPTIQPNDVVEMSIRGLLCGQTTLTVLHWRYDGADAVAMDVGLDTLDSSFRNIAGLLDKYKAAAAANFSFVELCLQMIHPLRFSRFVYPIAEVGGMAEDASTADLAAVILKSGWFAGDRLLHLAKGRTGLVHFAPVPKDKIVEGIIDNDYRTTELGAVGEKVTSPMGDLGAQWVPVLFHRNAEPKGTSDVTRYSVKPEARIMRRRTVGLGI